MSDSKKIIVALDGMSDHRALSFCDNFLSPDLCRVKVGKELFTLGGRHMVEGLVDLGYDVFLDLKFHDIPNTVAAAVSAAAKIGVWMVNVHASGGPDMMQKAKEALEPYGEKAPLLIAVTVLTSMDEANLRQVGVNKTPAEQAFHLAKLAKQAGLDGVVCSAQEAELLNSELGDSFKLVTPGIRPEGTDVGDQKRVMTPQMAVAAGSHYLVIGRPITQADDPQVALKAINASIAS